MLVRLGSMLTSTINIMCLHTGSTPDGVVLCSNSKIMKINKIVILPYSKKGVARMFNDALG